MSLTFLSSKFTEEENNNSISPVPIAPFPDCTDGFVNNIPNYIKYIAATTSALSVVGSILIILSYVCYKSLRTRAREVVVHISLMDLMAALANLIGIIIDFDKLLYRGNDYNDANLPEHYNTYNGLCIAQAAFAMYGTLASILWTLAITVYFYIRITAESDTKYTKRSIYFFYVICYVFPLLMVIWFLATGKLGYAPVGGSGWCSLITVTKDEANGVFNKDNFTLFFGNSLWLYVTFVLIPVISISLLIHLRFKVNPEGISHQDRSRVSLIEMKLLAIPVVFVFLRMWSEILTIIVVHTDNQSCGLLMFLLVMGGIGDSGQGFFNAIIFCLLNSKVRKAYLTTIKRCLTFCKRYKKCNMQEMDDPLIIQH